MTILDNLSKITIIQSMATITAETDIKPGNNIMEALLRTQPKVFLKIGDLIEGSPLGRKGAKIFLDLGVYGTGTIYGKEYQNAREIIKNLKLGDKVTAKVVELENKAGLIELSLKEAGSDMVWKDAKELKESQETLNLKALEANKGGMVLEWRGIKGFLPASQLKASHYPRVEGGDKTKIFDELKKLVGENMTVTILDFEPKENKLIFSEKGTESEDLKRVVEKYKIGEKVKAQIISIEGDKNSLSVKALKPNPWEINKEKYKKGDIVEGKVLRLNKFGALVFLQAGIYGLAHISEFGTEKRMREMVEAGQTYMFQIAVFHPEDRKLSLSFLGKDGQVPADLKPPKKEEAKEEKKED